MGKELSTYRAYTTTTLKERSSIPLQLDINEGTGLIDCSNIKISHVRSILEASTYGLYALCRHANVNPWSGFGPTVRSIASQNIVNSVPSVASLGSFAGYNHNAVAPSIQAKDTVKYPNNGASFDITADVVIGEARYYEELNILGVALAIYDGATFIAADVVDLSTITDIANLSVTCPGVNANKSYTGKLYFINNASSFNESYILAHIPNCSDFGVTVTVMQANSLDLQASGWTVVNAAFSSTTGWIGANSFSATSDHPGTEIRARITSQQTGLVVEEKVLWSGDYTANTTLTGIGDYLDNNYNVPYPNYGFVFQLAVYESS
jgi:hypothetical protein